MGAEAAPENADAEASAPAEDIDLELDNVDSDFQFIGEMYQHNLWNNDRGDNDYVNNQGQICQTTPATHRIFWDDISGKQLDAEMVLRAREDEMGED